MDFSNYEKQAPRAGQTIAHEVTELVNADGSHPIVHIEHLGLTNASYAQWVIARSKAGEPTTAGDWLGDDREVVIKHIVRRLERVFFSDGREATDEDIPKFIEAMPVRAFIRMRNFAIDERNFCEYPIAENPAALAEK